MKAYLQYADGREEELTVQDPDPADGTKVIPLSEDKWIRIVFETESK